MTKEKSFENYDTMMATFGELDSNIDKLRAAFDVKLIALGSTLRVSGESHNVESALDAIELIEKIAERETLIPAQIDMAIECARLKQKPDVDELMSVVAITAKGRTVRARTVGQKNYIDAINNNSIVFAIGPAGTGKTYLAVAIAAGKLKSGEVDKLILTRPAVEAGEKLGFLPGDLAEKVDPYLRPLSDALREFLGDDAYQRHIESGRIEIAPLAYMRGRTLKNSFIILDEAQNTTCEQMKMFLTRMGAGSHIAVTGDITQIDLPKNVISGLANAVEVLKGIDGIKAVYLSSSDVVRHPLVSRIVEAYESYENKAD